MKRQTLPDLVPREEPDFYKICELAPIPEQIEYEENDNMTYSSDDSGNFNKKKSSNHSAPSQTFDCRHDSNILHTDTLDCNHYNVSSGDSNILHADTLDCNHYNVSSGENVKRILNSDSESLMSSDLSRDSSLNSASEGVLVAMEVKGNAANLEGKSSLLKHFPSKLHSILSREDFSQYLTWSPSGTAWKVLKARQFASIILPQYFQHGKENV